MKDEITALSHPYRDNPDETEAAYAKRRFHQGLSLEEQRKMQKKKSRGNKKELFRKRQSLQSNPKLAEEKPHVRHNPLRLREWQMRVSKEATTGEVDTEETDIATDIDADAEEFFQQINDRRTFRSFGAINPLLMREMGAFGGVFIACDYVTKTTSVPGSHPGFSSLTGQNH